MRIKVCVKCGQEKLLSDFYGDKKSKNGYTSACKTCKIAYSKSYYRKNKRSCLKSRLNWRRKNAEKTRYYYRKSNLGLYGITPEQYDIMLEKQGGVCAICGQVETRMLNHKIVRLSVDHNHKTGKIRGLLCHKCNKNLAWYERHCISFKKHLSENK